LASLLRASWTVQRRRRRRQRRRQGGLAARNRAEAVCSTQMAAQLRNNLHLCTIRAKPVAQVQEAGCGNESLSALLVASVKNYYLIIYDKINERR